MRNRYRGPRRPLRERLAYFMYGRCGLDGLGRFIWIISLIIAFLNIFVRSVILSLLNSLLLIYVIFRFMSKNLVKRQAENAKYYNLRRKFLGFFSLGRAKFRDRKTHVFKKCPSCKNNLRLPKKKGRHTVHCLCCHTRFDVKI